MQLIIDFIRTKSILDSSQAIALKMIEENIGREEECIYLLFKSMYETNKALAEEVIRLRGEKPKIIKV